MSAAAMAAGSLLSTAANVYAQNQANKANQAMAREQMQFQERMSNSAHQREVADLKAAGLNPVLSAGGAGASSPSGAASTFTAPQIGDFGASLGSAFQLKMAKETQKQELANARAQEKLLDKQIETETWSARNQQQEVSKKTYDTAILRPKWLDNANNLKLTKNTAHLKNALKPRLSFFALKPKRLLINNRNPTLKIAMENILLQ